MPRAPSSRPALRQALVLAVVLASAVAAGVIVERRPAGNDELKISVGELRSQAAELELLLAQDDSALPPRFVRAQATQLARAVDQSRQGLQDLRLQPALQPRRDQARVLAAQVAAALQPLQAAHGPTAPASQAAAHAARRSLQTLEESLR
ncbi:MAG TPA: hypothetical protein VJ743_22030 [Albitalea sp.]|nr:hypothetical protein [Albitalea sp.]